MTNNIQDNNGNLYDNQSNLIGKVHPDGSVMDGYRDRGTVTNDGRYHDEYGRDQGWVVPGSKKSESSGGDGALAVAILALFTFGIYWLVKWIAADPKRKKVGIIVFLVWFGLAALVVIFQVLIYPNIYSPY